MSFEINKLSNFTLNPSFKSFFSNLKINIIDSQLLNLYLNFCYKYTIFNRVLKIAVLQHHKTSFQTYKPKDHPKSLNYPFNFYLHPL